MSIIPKINPAKVITQTQNLFFIFFEDIIYAIIANQIGDNIIIKNIKKKM